MEFVLIAICFLLCLAVLLKNEIVYRIRKRWIDEIYDSQVNGDGALEWGHLPTYDQTFYNPFLWKYKPLKEYLKIS